MSRPSKWHRWKLVAWTERTGALEQCERCGRIFVERADAHGPVHCFPMPQWLADHPDDQGRTT